MSTVQRLPTSGKFSGMIKGDALVPAGADLNVSGMIHGDLYIEARARAHVSGMVSGKIIDQGGDVTVSGMVG